MLRRKKIRKNRYRRPARRRSFRWAGQCLVGLRFMIYVGSLAAVSWGYVYLYSAVMQSDMLAAHTLKVSGNQRLTDVQVLAQARLKPRTNIFAINLKATRNRLLAHPWIAGASVQRIIPDTIQVHITEHMPLAVIDMGRKYLLDTQGIIFTEKKTQEANHLPVVRGLSYADLSLAKGRQPRQSLPKPPPSVGVLQLSAGRADPYRAMMEVLRMGSRKDAIVPNAEVKTVQIDRQMGLTLYAFENVIEIRLGFDHYQQKYAALKKVLRRVDSVANQQWGGIRSIDLKNPHRIVLNPIRQLHAAEKQKEV